MNPIVFYHANKTESDYLEAGENLQSLISKLEQSDEVFFGSERKSKIEKNYTRRFTLQKFI